MPEFTPIEEGQEPEEFIKGFEKFAEDVQGYMISADEQFSSVANRRLPNHGRLRDTAAALKKVALRAKEIRDFSPNRIISPISPRSRVESPREQSPYRELRANNLSRTCGTNTGNANSPEHSFVTCNS